MDPVCCETEEWMDSVGVKDFPRGPSQPFYQVLLDLKGGAKFPVAYGEHSFSRRQSGRLLSALSVDVGSPTRGTTESVMSPVSSALSARLSLEGSLNRSILTFLFCTQFVS